MRKTQTPRTKLQRKIKHPSPKARFGKNFFSFGGWSFFGALLAVLVVFGAINVQAQTNSLVLSSNRYLLILETSRGMDNRANGTLHAIKDLLLSGMGRQMKTGDSFGIWTYNNKLYTGRFPLQYWSPQTQKSTAQNALAFLQSQKCEKSGNLSLVLPTLQQVAKNSPVLTVILVTDGEQKIHGTPFDDSINKLYDRWRVEQAKAKMPLITILRAVSGQWTYFTVNAAPWAVEMPPLPKVEVAASTQPKPPAPKPPPPRGTNLIVSGKKIAESRAAMSNTLPSKATPPAPLPIPAQGDSKVQPPSATIETSTKQPVAAPVASTNPPIIVAQLAPSSSSPVTPSDSVKELSSPAALPVAPVATTPLPLDAPSKGGVEQSASSKQIPITETSTAVTAPVAKAVAPAPEPLSKTDVSVEPASLQRTNVRPAPAPPVAVAQRSGGNIMVMAGLIIAIIAAGALSVWAQRSRSAKNASLITRSLDRK